MKIKVSIRLVTKSEIKMVREKLDMHGYRHLADYAGVTAGMLSRWSKGECGMDHAKVNAVANWCGMDWLKLEVH